MTDFGTFFGTQPAYQLVLNTPLSYVALMHLVRGLAEEPVPIHPVNLVLPTLQISKSEISLLSTYVHDLHRLGYKIQIAVSKEVYIQLEFSGELDFLRKTSDIRDCL